MSMHSLGAGERAPEVVNVIIEIPMHEAGVKYEFDKGLGMLKVDRFLHAPVFYPYNYGYIPATCSGDGDPLDVIVISPCPVFPCTLIECKPAAVLFMEDESGKDEKVIAVPKDHVPLVTPEAEGRISYFFENYKKLDKGKWVSVERWGNIDEAKSVVMEAMKACRS